VDGEGIAEEGPHPGKSTTSAMSRRRDLAVTAVSAWPPGAVTRTPVAASSGASAAEVDE
jgi:hypothetical protein